MDKFVKWALIGLVGIGIAFGSAYKLCETKNGSRAVENGSRAIANLHYHKVPLQTDYVSRSWGGRVQRGLSHRQTHLQAVDMREEAYTYISNPGLYPPEYLMDDIYRHNSSDYGKTGDEINLPCDGGAKCPVVKDKQIMEDLEKIRSKGNEAIEILKKK